MIDYKKTPIKSPSVLWLHMTVIIVLHTLIYALLRSLGYTDSLSFIITGFLSLCNILIPNLLVYSQGQLKFHHLASYSIIPSFFLLLHVILLSYFKFSLTTSLSVLTFVILGLISYRIHRLNLKNKDFANTFNEKHFPILKSRNLTSKVLYIYTNTSRTDKINENLDLMITTKNNLNMTLRSVNQIQELMILLKEYKPNILHISGHVNFNQEIVLQDIRGNKTSISAQNLSKIIKKAQSSASIKGVILDSCYSSLSAKTIVDEVNWVLYVPKGNNEIQNKIFFEDFYRSLDRSRNVKDAYEAAKHNAQEPYPDTIFEESLALLANKEQSDYLLSIP